MKKAKLWYGATLSALLSISALFGGLALTIITADKGDNTNE